MTQTDIKDIATILLSDQNQFEKMCQSLPSDRIQTISDLMTKTSMTISMNPSVLNDISKEMANIVIDRFR